MMSPTVQYNRSVSNSNPSISSATPRIGWCRDGECPADESAVDGRVGGFWESWVSKSFISFLSEISSSASGAITRSLSVTPPRGDSAIISGAAASASGFIGANPRHWAIESYIPIDSRELVEYLVHRDDAKGLDIDSFRAAVTLIGAKLAEQSARDDDQFDQQYRTLDPDQHSRHPVGLEAAIDESVEAVERAMSTCCEILNRAGYREVTRPELEACVGVASQWGVPLHVDFTMFNQLVVYCRGDVIGNRVCRRLLKFYRIEAVEVAVYQRMIVMFRLQEDVPGDEELLARSLHLRMFKNIPKLDIDMLLPCTKVKFTWLDRLKIIVPSIGGVLMSARKIINTILIIAVLTLKSTFVLVGLFVAAVGYIVRSVLGYFQTKNRYLLNLTRNLYFQKLDSNAGVGYQIIHQAREQSVTEAILAYYAILTSDVPLSNRKWQRRCERIVREAIDLEVDVNIDRASARLATWELITHDETSSRWLGRPLEDLANEPQS